MHTNANHIVAASLTRARVRTPIPYKRTDLSLLVHMMPRLPLARATHRVETKRIYGRHLVVGVVDRPEIMYLVCE